MTHSRITVIGGGNIGTLMAAEFSHKGHAVTLFTSKPDNWSNTLSVYDSAGSKLLESNRIFITDDLQQAVSGADLIWVVYPAFLFSAISEKLLPYTKPGQMIGVVPGSGGAEFAFRPHIQRGCTFFGLQRVHSIARIKEPGASVFALGRKNELYFSAFPAAQAEPLKVLLESLFDLPCTILPNYLNVTLTPSNPILHTSRLYSMFSANPPDTVYPQNPYFYEDWDEDSSRVLFACDAELQALCKRIDSLDLSGIVSLSTYYESPTPLALKNKIQSIQAFRGIQSPMNPVKDGWVMDLTSRYFTADFSFGLKVIHDFCKRFDVSDPWLETLWHWYQSIALYPTHFFLDPGLTPKEITAFYRRSQYGTL